MDRRSIENTMKIPAIAVAAFAIIFAASTSRLMPIYAAPAQPLADEAPPAVHKKNPAETARGAQVFKANCAACHGQNRQGTPPLFPSLIGVGKRLTVQQEEKIIHNGRGQMPPFPNLQKQELASLLYFLNDGKMATAKSTSASDAHMASPTVPVAPAVVHVASGPLATGGSLFQQNCAFCHGRDAAGGESGPDLTRSKLVATDRRGDKISEVVRNGRTEGDKKMPAFKFSDSEMDAIVAFIHDQTRKANAKPGSRRGVDVADLQTGDVAAGKQYFEGPGGCASCHSPTGDLAHVASKYEGLELEQRMLYPRNVKSKVTVTLPSGEKASGTVAYLDEFTVGLLDPTGRYRSWPVRAVKYSVESPVDAHVAQFPKYTDPDIHNLMAYMQTLR